MSYVDGFVLVVPKRKLAIYKKMARRAATVWRDHGALYYRECVGDDAKPEETRMCPTATSRRVAAVARGPLGGVDFLLRSRRYQALGT